LTDVAPMHVSSSMYLTLVGFFDGLAFHRVIQGFMAQGGCPLGTGTGSPGYRFGGEFDSNVRHDRPGLLSQANAGPGTDGSQFFLTFVPTPHLDGKHTIYGEVVAGMDTVQKMNQLGASGDGPPQKPISITRATISMKTIEALPSAADDATAALAELAKFIAAQNIDKSVRGWKTKLPKPPQATFSEGRTYHWNVRTNKGDIVVKLMPETAPMHVSSLIYLARLGFYDGIAFHRVIPRFMAQGGCPLGNGRGNPGYAFEGEFDPNVKHDRPGLLSQANAGPGTDGSQFFLTFVPTPHLDGKHTIYGEVVSGMGVVKALEKAGTRAGRPTEPLKIIQTSITIE